MRKSDDLIRAVSRHTLSYMLCAISEMFRHYVDFDPLDLLIVHAILNANVIHIMSDQELDKRYSSIHAVEPDDLKLRISRAALARFLNLPLETVRRRVARLKERGILAEENSGLIVTQKNLFRFGNNHHLQTTNIVLVRKLLNDLRRAGIRGAEDLRGLRARER
jgi:Winged helix-turn-helix DNA-binding